MSLLWIIVVAIIVAILLILAVDYLAKGLGGDARLYFVLKALIVLIAALFVAQKAGMI